MTAKIDISPEQLAIVQVLLKDHLPNGTLAWAFGSRVTWTAKPFSDLDIALEGAEPLPSEVLIDLEEAFEASDLPWKVDVIDLNAVSPEFREIVERQRVPADWRDLQLHEVGKIVTGKTPPTSNPDFYDGYIPFVTPSDMDGRRRIETTARNLSADGAKKVGSSYVDRPAISVSCIGSDMGKAALVDPPFVSNQQINSVIVSDDYDRLFIYYNLSARKEEIRNRAGGAAQPIMNKSDFGKLNIYAPFKPEQTRISNILGTLDDKIELNRRMNETLEAMARAVFRDWFVDFGPTRRKAAGTADPAAILGGLLPDPTQAAPLAALFPDSFGANGLPEGWEEREVGSFAKLKGGKQLPKTEFVEDGDIPVFGGAGLMGNTDKANASGYVISVGRVGAYCGNFVAHRGRAWINNNASFFELENGTKPEWFFYALRELDLTTIRKGAAQPFVSNSDIAKLSLVFPGDPVLETFHGILLPLVQLIEANEQENQTLAATRDLLLPKLMSGELRLTGVEDL
ncbi:restriction endonuclease subunit S [Roseicyclus mahoneyensis]|uniref:Type I restriction enzyme S subunit n=1 Tax=Roseicyclus mahoneyensis TaxID=164332 RepID=A0A316GBB5_9RHOB|nr:restriction endonuclease subunit S [Roseicyclus mahoneyensis]PWK57306.1 type I restriction enzyme S subunit [Roseicyclus mahoneyensis]